MGLICSGFTAVVLTPWTQHRSMFAGAVFSIVVFIEPTVTCQKQTKRPLLAGSEPILWET